jgi:hypothetical protein
LSSRWRTDADGFLGLSFAMGGSVELRSRIYYEARAGWALPDRSSRFSAFKYSIYAGACRSSQQLMRATSDEQRQKGWRLPRHALMLKDGIANCQSESSNGTG